MKNNSFFENRSNDAVNWRFRFGNRTRTWIPWWHHCLQRAFFSSNFQLILSPILLFCVANLRQSRTVAGDSSFIAMTPFLFYTSWKWKNSLNKKKARNCTRYSQNEPPPGIRKNRRQNIRTWIRNQCWRGASPRHHHRYGSTGWRLLYVRVTVSWAKKICFPRYLNHRRRF